MIVALDVGNTNVTMGVIREGDVTASHRAPTAENASPHALAATLDEFLRTEGASFSDLRELVVSSVVPVVTQAIATLADAHDIGLLIADSTSVPIPVRVDTPATVGDDRLVNALAAARLYGQPAIVVDLGTATTFDVVAADGAFAGGAIAPGIGLGLEALATGTAQLPRVPLVMPPRAIGRDTVSAMQSGAVVGYLGLVTALIQAITAELALDGGDPPKVILTGGLAQADFALAIPGVDAIDPLLTLRGLALLHAQVRGGNPGAHSAESTQSVAQA